jgi:signal transduction histidine kinase
VWQSEISHIKHNIMTVISHELRTPLTYVVAYADMAHRDADELDVEDMRAFLRGINTGANRLRRLVENFILLVELETGELVYSTDQGEGHVGVVVYPWEVSIGRLRHEDSAMNLIQGDIRSVAAVGNRVRVRVGPITAEVTALSAEKLELARGGTVFATFKATGTRLVPLA